MYTIIVTKLPQEAENSLAQEYMAYANAYKRTTVYSLDDTLRLMANPLGNDRSHVEIVNPDEVSQVATIAELDKQGITWVDITKLSNTNVLDINPNYSQNDSQWRYYPLGDGSQPSTTIGSWGCLGTVYATMANHMLLCTDNPQQFNDRMVREGAMYGVYVQAGALRTCFPDKVSYQGWFTTDIQRRVEEQVAKGIPVPARVDLDPSSGYTQHWVLLTGYDDDNNLIIADPYHYPSTIKEQASTIYDKIHEVLIYDYGTDVLPPPVSNTIDLAPYFSCVGNSNLFELQTEGAGTERVQLKQYDGGISHITKNAVYEELKVTDTHIQRSVDTSMDNEHLYYLAGVGEFVDWMKRHMAIGEQFKSQPVVTVKRKSDCNTVSVNGTVDYLTLKAHHNTFEGFNGVVVNDVIEVEWRKSTNGRVEETYFFAAGLSLVGWGTSDGTGRVARVSEIHDAGQRPDNQETYYCGWS